MKHIEDQLLKLEQDEERNNSEGSKSSTRIHIEDEEDRREDRRRGSEEANEAKSLVILIFLPASMVQLQIKRTLVLPNFLGWKEVNKTKAKKVSKEQH